MKKITKLFVGTALTFSLVTTNILPSISLNAENKIQVNRNQTASASYDKAPKNYDGSFITTQEYTVPETVVRAINGATAGGAALLLQKPLQKLFPRLPGSAITVLATALGSAVAGAKPLYFKLTSYNKYVWNKYPTKCTYYTTTYIYSKPTKNSTHWTYLKRVDSIKTYEIDLNTD